MQLGQTDLQALPAQQVIKVRQELLAIMVAMVATALKEQQVAQAQPVLPVLKAKKVK